MKHFSISNFKSFSKEQQIPIKPITLIYGANSAGKSSIIHSYLLLKNILNLGKSNVKTLKTPWDNVDIGGFKQYVYKHRYDSNVTFSILGDNEEKLIITVGGARTDDKGRLLNDEVYITSIEIFIENEQVVKLIKKYEVKEKNDFKIINFNVAGQAWLNFIKEFEYDTIDNAINFEGIVKNISFDFNLFISGYAHDVFSVDTCENCFLVDSKYRDTVDIFIKFLSTKLVSLFLPIWKQEDNKKIVTNYIGPLRNFPPRVISDEEKGDDTADKTWEILLQNKKVRDKVNKWLGNPDLMKPAYQLKVEQKVNPDDLMIPFLELLSNINLEDGYIPDELESIINIETNYDYDGPIGHQVSFDSYGIDSSSEIVENILKDQKGIDTYKKLVLMDKRSEIPVSLRDVGVGISQVLPVLVNAYSPDNSIVAIEQPEIHLHPKLQSELADVFIETALGKKKKTFLIETHSEHLLLRIMRRIRETTNGDLPSDKIPINAEDVQILFVMPNQNGEGSVVKKIALRNNGELKNRWPGGFFEESFNEIF